MSLEFTRLSQLTGDPRYFDAVQRIANVMESEQMQTKIPGLWPVVFNAQTQSFKDEREFTLGGRADSMYEYVPKEYIILGGNSEQHRRMYIEWIGAAQEHLFFRPMNPDNLDILIAGSARVDNDGIVLKPEGQHLTCFLGGLIALGSKVFGRTADLDVARKLVDGCVWAYDSTATGIMPEIFTAIPPTSKSGAKNKWDKARWLDAINTAWPIGSEDEVKDKDARAEKVVEALRLPKGMPKVNDQRYILRCVL
jgi:mannosyl-oligosaccharide alpha-1,2-mannosidase